MCVTVLVADNCKQRVWCMVCWASPFVALARHNIQPLMVYALCVCSHTSPYRVQALLSHHHQCGRLLPQGRLQKSAPSSTLTDPIAKCVDVLRSSYRVLAAKSVSASWSPVRRPDAELADVPFFGKQLCAVCSSARNKQAPVQCLPNFNFSSPMT